MRSWKVWLGLALLSLASLVMVAAPVASEHGIDLANLDRTCAPCKDFNQFVNGGWMAKNPIPPAYPSWGVGNEVAERNREVLHQILEDAAKNTSAPRGSNEQKIGDYYGSCMDTATIDSEGLKPIEPEFDRIRQIADLAGLEAEIAHLQSIGVDAFFEVGSTQDFENSEEVTGGLDQGGLGLPDRDYYTRDDPKSKEQRDEYQKHVAKMFELMGDPAATAATEAQTVMDLETQLAKASQTEVERREPKNLYHRMPQSGLRTLAPSFPWEKYFSAVGLAGKGDVNVTAPDFFKGMGNMLASVPMDNWKTYLRWHLINAAAPSLSAPFVDEDFHFNGMILKGTKENLPRWKRCVRATDAALGEALGQVYVKKAFPPEGEKSELKSTEYTAVFLLDRETSIASRFGEDVRQKVLRFVQQHLKESLMASDRVIRWKGAAFLASMKRVGSIQDVRAELTSVASISAPQSVDVGNRSIRLPISLSWAAFSQARFASLDLLFEKVDDFIARAQGAK